MDKTNSLRIDAAISLAIDKDNSVKELSFGWSKVQQVVHMTSELTANLRGIIQNQLPSLRYWSSEATPHNPVDEGFMCDETSVAISFPRSR